MIANKMSASILAGVMGLWLGLISTAHAQERAHAELKNANGKTVGTAALRQTKEGVAILIQVTARSARPFDWKMRGARIRERRRTF
jgi:hypothetical protein